MTMPMVEGGRPILSVRLFGFPVTVDISFVVITAIIGWVPGRTTVTSFVVWLVMVPLAVLVHELGHAYTCKHFGGQVNEMGFMLLYFEPCFYCNVNDAWTFP